MAKTASEPTLAHEEVREPTRKGYATAAEALKLLDVRPQTLYAYVSRGWIRSIPHGGRNGRLYLVQDLERMAARSRARSGHGAVAASAMNWGEPIIPTAITEITAQGPCYRGRSAVELARQHVQFESVAELLWTGLLQDGVRWPVLSKAADHKRVAAALTSVPPGDQLLEVFAMVTLQLGVSRGSVTDRVREGRTLDAARQVMQTLAGCCGLAARKGSYVPLAPGQSLTEGIVSAFDLPATAENFEAIGAWLTLMADHELSPGTFSARIAASGGCTLHSCIASGLCASSGLEVGRIYQRVDEFLQAGTTAAALIRSAERLQERGLVTPGFGHPLYPHGDPRARYLLELVQQRSGQDRAVKAVFTFLDAMRERYGLYPRHEFACVVLARQMRLPRQAPAALFVLARTAGWVAHVQEQRLSGALLRPRAKFAGQPHGGFSA